MKKNATLTYLPFEEFWGKKRHVKNFGINFPFGILSYSWGIWSKHLLTKKCHVENFGINFWYALLLLRNLKKAFTNEKTPRRESWNQENHQKWTFILPDRERKIYLWRGQSNQRKKVWDRIIAYLCGALDWSSFFTQERLKNPKEPVGNVYLINFQIRSSFPSSWHDI